MMKFDEYRPARVCRGGQQAPTCAETSTLAATHATVNPSPQLALSLVTMQRFAATFLLWRNGTLLFGAYINCQYNCIYVKYGVLFCKKS